MTGVQTCALPIFTAARVLSIRHAIPARATPERLRGALAAGVGSPAIVEAILDAQREIMAHMLEQQLRDGLDGLPLSTRIDPRRLDKPARMRLKNAIETVEEALGLVAEGRV